MSRRLRSPGGVLALTRALAVPVFFVGERIVDHPAQNSGPFDLLLAGAALYTLASLVAELAGRPAPPWLLASADTVFIAVLVETSGGPFSDLRYAFFLLPIGAALLLTPRATAVASLAAVAIYAFIALTYPGAEAVRPDSTGFRINQVLFLAWMGGAATLLSGLLARRAERIEALAGARRRLLAEALDAEDRARRRLAEALHDDALQNVLAARQLLGDPELVREALDLAAVQLREAMFDLHPYLLEEAGLRAALQAVAERAGQRAGLTVEVDVEEEAAGAHDSLLFSLARELVANVARHAQAERMWVSVRRRNGAVELTVADDGRGVDPERVESALREGHIGLASCRERAEDAGGDLRVEPGPGGCGTRVRARIPASRFTSTRQPRYSALEQGKEG